MSHLIGKHFEGMAQFFPLMGLKHNMEKTQVQVDKQQEFLAGLIDKKDFKCGMMNDW